MDMRGGFGGPGTGACIGVSYGVLADSDMTALFDPSGVTTTVESSSGDSEASITKG
jgi:hypothetical protein